MPRFKLTLEYAGTRYSGWQIQQNARTVQGELQRAIREALGDREATTYGAGRTARARQRAAARRSPRRRVGADQAPLDMQ